MRAARLAHELHMMQIGAAVEPLIGARQRRCARARVEGLHRGRICRLKPRGRSAQARLDFAPAIKRRLQRRGDIRDREAARERAIDDDELAVAPAPRRLASFICRVRQLST